MADKVDEKGFKGFHARFKNLHIRPESQNKGAIDDASKVTTLSVTSKSSFRRSINTENVDNQKKLDASSKKECKRSRRQEAEDELKAAARTLNTAMSKVSQRVQVPEALTLEDIDHVDDMEGTAQEIAKTIDKFMDDRTFKMSLASRIVWKDYVKR